MDNEMGRKMCPHYFEDFPKGNLPSLLELTLWLFPIFYRPFHPSSIQAIFPPSIFILPTFQTFSQIPHHGSSRAQLGALRITYVLCGVMG
jgi:hypothetical protein